MKQRTVCLVTSGNLASDPRLVKEASALQQAGYAVRIIAADIIPSLSPFDDVLSARLNYDVTKVPYLNPGWKRLGRSLRQRGARSVFAWMGSGGHKLAVLAHHPLIPALRREAGRQPADLFIAHNLAALPAVGAAAAKYQAKLGFDAEDYHCGELDGSQAHSLELRIRRAIESYWLPRCQHLTCASPLIGEAYEQDYGVKMTTILNVFPLVEAPDRPVTPASAHGELPSLYWFSQTVGRDRGVEEMVSAMALMKTRARLSLRGNPSAGFEDELLAHARARGGDDLAARIKFLPVAAPDEMVGLAAAHDLGLGLEPSQPVNRDICLTNKAFTYLLAGIPVVLSRTRAQAALAAELGAAAILLELTNPTQAASLLDGYFNDKIKRSEARAEAWRLGRECYNWDVEKTKLLSSLADVFSEKGAGEETHHARLS